MATWLKLIGTTGQPMPADWATAYPDALECTWFGRRPSVAMGELMIYYAVGRHRVCAVMEAASSPAKATQFPPHWTEGDKTRWPWVVRVLPRLTILADDYAPALEEIGVARLSVRRQSHIKLSDEQAAVALRTLVLASLQSWTRRLENSR